MSNRLTFLLFASVFTLMVGCTSNDDNNNKVTPDPNTPLKIEDFKLTQLNYDTSSIVNPTQMVAGSRLQLSA